MTLEEIRADIVNAIKNTDMVPVRKSYGMVNQDGQRCGCALSILAHHDKISPPSGLNMAGFYFSRAIWNHASDKYGWDWEQVHWFIRGFDAEHDYDVAPADASHVPMFDLGQSIAREVL